MPKRILIISDPIAPPSYAPRVTTMFRYLQEAGHEVVLESGEIGSKASVWQFVADKLWWQIDRDFAKKLESKYPKGRFDVILCTTYYYFPLLTARQLSRKWDIPYVVDLRDIVEQWGQASYFTSRLPNLLGLEKLFARWYERHNLRWRNRIIREAKAVTTVSPWHRDYLQTLTSRPVHLVYNGFDDKEIAYRECRSDIFRVTFIGRFINLRLRQPHMLLEAVGELLQEGAIEPQHFVIDLYAEPDKEAEVMTIAKQYRAKSCVEWHPFVSRDQLSSVMAEASVLLALGCPPEDGQHGILGTKVFEAIGAEKPLLLVPSDEDSLAQLIRETGIGCAAGSKEEVKTFLLEQYAIWQQQGFTRQHVARRSEFSRRAEALQMETILCK